MPSYMWPTLRFAAGADIGGQAYLSINNTQVAEVPYMVQQTRALNPAMVVFGTNTTVRTYNSATGEILQVANQGANWIRGGYDRWCARLQSNPPLYFDSKGRYLTNSDWRPIATCDGGMILSTYQAGIGLYLMRDNGDIVTLLPSSVAVFGDEGAAYGDRWAMRLNLTTIAVGSWSYPNAPVTYLSVPSSRGVAMLNGLVLTQGTDDGTWYLIDFYNKKIATIPALPALGYAPAMADIDIDKFQIVASSTQSCSPGTIWAAQINIDDLDWGPLTAPVPKVGTFNDPMWVGPYHAQTVQYGRNKKNEYVGNVVLVLNQPGYNEEQNRQFLADPLTHLGMSVICTPENYTPEVESQVIAFYVQSSGDEGEGVLHARVNEATEKAANRWPVLAYVDKPNGWNYGSDIHLDPSRVWPALQAYRDPNEPIDVFDQRIRLSIHNLAIRGYRPWVVAQAYTRNGLVPVSHSLESLSLFPSWRRDYPEIAGTLPFADRRPSGMLQYPAIRAVIQQWMTMIPHERANRYNFWFSGDVDREIRNILGQTRESVMLTYRHRQRILDAIETVRRMEGK